MKEKAMPLRAVKCFQLSIFFFLLTSAIPVTGYSLKNCRISQYFNAICSNKNLTAIPQDIPSRVKNLDLSKNNISKISVSDFKALRNLTYLNLSHNNISEIEKFAFSKLNSLEVLQLNTNKLGELRDHVFHGLSNLTDLWLVNNHIKTVTSSSFQSLTSLRFLNLDVNNLHCLTRVQSILQHLPHLQVLSIKQNNLSMFQSGKLSNKSLELTSLDLSRNPIEVFKITADVFPNLTSFKLSYSGKKHGMIWDVYNKTFLRRVSTLDISGLHLSFEGMKTLLGSFSSSLTFLSMNAMQSNLVGLINISCTVTPVTTLQLRQNNLTVVPSSMLQSCSNVTDLDLKNNLIQNVSDDSFRNLQGLKTLNLTGNKLSSVPGATRNLPTLIQLDLSDNIISALGCHDFANLTRLRVLQLRNNSISKFNGAFKNDLPNLQILDLSGNKLTAITKGEFANLRSLQTLSLHGNQIKTLETGGFIGLINLRTIQLQCNALTEPQINVGVFSALRNLTWLNLMQNHIKYKTAEALSNPPFSQLSHLETLLISGQHHKLKSHLPPNFLQGLTNLLEFHTRNVQLTFLHPNTFKYTPQLYKLDLSSNDLTDVSADLFSPIQNLESLYMSRTSLQSLDFILQANLTKLEFLQLRKNSFPVISEMVIQSLPALLYLDVEGKSFTCNCDNAWFIIWVESNNQTEVPDAYNLECNYPLGMRLLDINVDSCSIDICLSRFISSSCVVLLLLVVSFTYHFFKWQLVYAYYLFLAFPVNTKQKNKQAPHQYDAFVSYNIHDEPWVLRELLPKLEGEQGWRLCLHHRDFEPGKPIIDNITNAIYGSRKTICVISHRYLQSEWCSREIQVASFRLFDEQEDVLILVFLEEIPVRQLSSYYRMRGLLKRRTYLSWPRAGQHTGLFWGKLRQALENRGDPAGERRLDLAARP